MTTTCSTTSTCAVARLRAALTRLSRSGRTQNLLDRQDRRTLDCLARDFATLCHAHQSVPAVARGGEPWTTWLMLAGRGAGKTRAGAEWVRGLALGRPPFAERPHRRIALVADDEHDVRAVMIEGESGLLRISPRGERPLWIPSRRRLEWPNGAVAEAFSADDPESLRGPQFEAAWCDELGKWRYAEAAFDMLQFGLRLGARPRQVVTTTPRPIPLIRRLIADPHTAVTRAATAANAAYLAPGFIAGIVARYAGTRLGRQELDGEMIEERSDALWTRAIIEAARVAHAPALQRIVVAVDPPASSGKRSDACGLVAAGRAENGLVYVLADETVAALSPAGWAAKAVALWRRLDADVLVVEVNQGGEMARAVLREADPTVPVTMVRATRSKWLRAEPVSTLYEQGKVRHVGAFAALEDEMCDFGLDGLSSGRSPDRLDALVWAVASLSFGESTGPRLRGL